MAPPPPSPWPHYAWALGHAILLACTMRYLFTVLTFKSARYVLWYKSAYAGALVSYAIVCFKALGVPQLSPAFFQRAVIDENVQYFLLALYWFISKPVWPSLIPFATFSVFHTLTFLRTNVIPRALPAPKPANPPVSGQSSRPEQHPLGKSIGTWVKRNYEVAMQVVAVAELCIFAWLVLGVLARQTSLWSPMIYFHFLRQRYYYSSFTCQAVDSFVALLDHWLSQPSIPGLVRNVWLYGKTAVERYAASVGPVPARGPAPAGAGAGARPATR